VAKIRWLLYRMPLSRNVYSEGQGVLEYSAVKADVIMTAKGVCRRFYRLNHLSFAARFGSLNYGTLSNKD